MEIFFTILIMTLVVSLSGVVTRVLPFQVPLPLIQIGIGALLALAAPLIARVREPARPLMAWAGIASPKQASPPLGLTGIRPPMVVSPARSSASPR